MAGTKQQFLVKLDFFEPLNIQGTVITAAQVASDILAGIATDSSIPTPPTVEVFVPAGSGE